MCYAVTEGATSDCSDRIRQFRPAPSEPLRIMLAEWGIVPSGRRCHTRRVENSAVARSSWGDSAGYAARRVRSQGANWQAGAQRRRPGVFERSPGRYLEQKPTAPIRNVFSRRGVV
jgi:hypothetical protein